MGGIFTLQFRIRCFCQNFKFYNKNHKFLQYFAPMEIPAPEGRDRGLILKTSIVVHYCYYYATCVRSTTSSRSLAVVLLTPVL